MDMYSTSFTAARTPRDLDSLLLTALSAHGCSVSHYPLPPSPSSSSPASFAISGSPAHVLRTRALLLAHAPPVVRSSLRVPRSLILDMPFSTSPALNPVVRAHLDEIASITQAHIAVVNSPVSTRGVSMPISKDAPGLETERLCELVISAEEDAVDLARVRLLVMLDELSGLHSESLEIEHKLLPIIAGRKRSTLQSIQEETATNIYYPSPLQLPPATDSPKNKNTLWITGEFFGVQRARDMLFQFAAQKSTSLLSKDTALLPRKLDFLLLHHSDDLKSLMADTASYIHLPPLGSSTPLVTVYSDSRVNVARAMRGVMQLITQFFIASYWLLPTHFNTLLPPTTSALQLSLALNKPLPPSASPFPPPPPPFSSTSTNTNTSSNASGPPGTGPGPGSSTNAQSTTPMTTLLQQISIASGAEVVFKGMCFEMHGLEPQVRKAVSMIMELDIVKSFHHEVRFQLELSNEHRDFISGKKNGKINKITQSFSSPSSFPQSSSSSQPPLSIPSHLPPQQPPKIKFETLNDSNFLIDLSSPSPITSLSALTLLMEELPAEISFHVPEVYHKRIIGVGGRSIQRIMKRFGVYVKFLSGEEVRGGGLGVGMNMGNGMGMGMSNGGVKPGTVVGDRYTDKDWEMEDNVVARTPAKNAVNLEHLKASVMELVAPKDKDFTTETLSIPRRYHRTLLGEKGIFIHDIEQKTNSRVRFPDKESGSDVVVIYGPESQVGITAAMLLDHVPFEADMILPPHPDLPRVTCSTEFNNLVEHIKRELQVSIVPNFKRFTSSSSTGSPPIANKNMNGVAASTNTPSPVAQTMTTTRESPTDITQPQTQQQQHPSDYTFKFRCQRSNTDFLPTAREMLEQFLIKHHVYGYPPASSTSGTASGSTPLTTTTTTSAATSTSGGTNTGPSSATATSPSSAGTTHRRTDSFADAFPHFESRVLAASNVGSGFGSVLSRTRGHESMDMGRPDLSLLSERRLRLANSSPDVKALFNAPAYIYNLEALEAASSVGSSGGDDLGYAESYDGGGYAGSSGEGTGTTGGDSDLDYWTPTSLVPISSAAPTRTRQAHDALKRGSDSLLEAKIKEQHQMQMQSNKTRSLTNRAQSLDLTHSLALARISEGGSGSGGASRGGATGGGGGGSGHASTSGSPSLGNVGLGAGGGYAGYSQLQRYYQQQIPHEQEYEYEHEHEHDGTGPSGGGVDYPDSPRTAGTTSTTTGSNSGSTSMSFGGGVGDEPVFEFAGGGAVGGNSNNGVEDPTTTTQPSFPSVYAPPGQHSHSHSGSARSSGVFGVSSSSGATSSSGGYGSVMQSGNGSALGGGWMTSDHHHHPQPQPQQYSHFYHHHHLSHGSHHFSQQQQQQQQSQAQAQTHRHTASSSAIPLRTSGLGLGSSTRSKEEEESVDQMSRVMSNLGL